MMRKNGTCVSLVKNCNPLMSLKKCFSLLALYLLSSLITMSLLAQDAAKRAESSPSSVVRDGEADIPSKSVEFSPLFQADAKKSLGELIRNMEDDIRALHILIKNYGDQVSGAQQAFEAIQEKHKKALVRSYRGQNTWSLSLYRENNEQVQDLFRKFMAKYQERTLGLLAELAEKLADMKLKQATERGQYGLIVEPGRTYYKYIENSAGLKFAYRQNSMAREMQVKDQPKEAIEHYRLAKVLAIRTLHKMENDPDERKKLEIKYSRDLLDSRGLIASNR